MNRYPFHTNNKAIIKNPDHYLITTYQNMGYNRDLVIQAWNESQGNANLLPRALIRLSRQPQQRSQNFRIKRIPDSTIIKKMPIMQHVHLKFKGNPALESFELRKLGLFSKKSFRNAHSLNLEYHGHLGLKDKHIEILANHMNRGLRKLRNLSIEMKFGPHIPVDMEPLLKTIKQNFVGLVSLRLVLGEFFSFSAWDMKDFERVFRNISSTLKNLSLEFRTEKIVGVVSRFEEDQKRNRQIFSEALGEMIMNFLPRLESLCLNWDHKDFSTKIVGQLISGASTHLIHLKSLDLSLEKCDLSQVEWNLFLKGRRSTRLSSSLQDLKLNFNGCEGLSLKFLTMLRNEIILFCPDLKRLFICTEKFARFSNGFYASLEKEFLQKLKNLKWLRLLYSQKREDAMQMNLEIALSKYQEAQISELERTMKMEEEVEKVKQWAHGEEEIDLYYKFLREEEQAAPPIRHEFNRDMMELEDQDYDGNDDNSYEKAAYAAMEAEERELDNANAAIIAEAEENEGRFIRQDFYFDYLAQQEDLQNRAEEEIRFRDLTQGGQVKQIYLDYDDGYGDNDEYY